MDFYFLLQHLKNVGHDSTCVSRVSLGFFRKSLRGQINSCRWSHPLSLGRGRQPDLKMLRCCPTQAVAMGSPGMCDLVLCGGRCHRQQERRVLLTHGSHLALCRLLGLRRVRKSKWSLMLGSSAGSGS